MTNKTFIQSLAERLGMSESETTLLAQQFVDTFMQQVKDGSLVSIQGFGNFEIKTKAERKMYNPTTKSFSMIPSKEALVFKMSATLKNRVNKNNKE